MATEFKDVIEGSGQPVVFARKEITGTDLLQCRDREKMSELFKYCHSSCSTFYYYPLTSFIWCVTI